MLSRAFALHDVADVEALAGRALDAQLRSMGAHLSEHDREDALSFLITACWEASLKYDPARFSSFSNFAYRLCRQRTIDFIRSHNGRSRWKFKNYTYERERPTLVSLDGADGSGLGSTLASRTGDPADDRCPDLMRVLKG